MRELPYKDLKPDEIEAKSMEIIGKELARMGIFPDDDKAPVIMRTIHTTADFDYANNLCFSDNAVPALKRAISAGACIVTDTQMARAGINKGKLSGFGAEALCFMSDKDIAEESKKTGRTRAALSMDKAAGLGRDTVFVIGNAPTALIRLYELVTGGIIRPKGIIAVPVGFVNVVEAKELIMELSCPYIAARGRKGGSTVAAAIINALLYSM
jgi:precorrin-8X/cobalt-precorrin-8 methylmutase